MISTERNTGIYSSMETEPREKMKDWKLDRVQALIQTAAEKSPPFAKRLSDAGLKAADIRSFADFRQIPPLSKKTLMDLQKENFADLLTVEPGRLSRIYQSPGPLFDPEGREKDYWGWAEAFFAAGFRPNDLVQNTFSYHLTPAGLMLEEPLRRIGCAVIPAGPGNTDVQADLMTQLPVTGFVGMASFLKIIGEKAAARGIDPATEMHMDVAFVLAEILTPTLRKSVEDLFDMRVLQGYGTADLGCIAYECREVTGMHLSTRAHVEICEPGTGNALQAGEVGEVVVTPFPKAYPMIRLATGDLSCMIEDSCPCGRTAPRLTGILGRTDMTVKVKGQFIYPHQVKEALSVFPELTAWQVRVTNPAGQDILELIVPADEAVPADKLADAFQSVLKLRPTITPDSVGILEKEGAPPVVDERVWE